MVRKSIGAKALRVLWLAGTIVLILSPHVANATAIAFAEIASGFGGIGCQNCTATRISGETLVAVASATSNGQSLVIDTASAEFSITGVTGASYFIGFQVGGVELEALASNPLLEGAFAAYGVRRDRTRWNAFVLRS